MLLDLASHSGEPVTVMGSRERSVKLLHFTTCEQKNAINVLPSASSQPLSPADN